MASDDLPPQEIIDIIHFTWSRMRDSLSRDLLQHGYARAAGMAKIRASDISSISSIESTAQIHNLGFEMRYRRPIFPGFPYTYRVVCFGVEVESGPCPEDFEPA